MGIPSCHCQFDFDAAISHNFRIADVCAVQVREEVEQGEHRDQTPVDLAVHGLLAILGEGLEELAVLDRVDVIRRLNAVLFEDTALTPTLAVSAPSDTPRPSSRCVNSDSC